MQMDRLQGSQNLEYYSDLFLYDIELLTNGDFLVEMANFHLVFTEMAVDKLYLQK